ncbi:MAG: hypothetical protein HYY17_06225 [Planctomycetes bacterium]|nr:hypothetical protein [Planctomycetota bacterium]
MNRKHGWIGTASFVALAALFLAGYATSTGELPGFLAAVKAGVVLWIMNLFVSGTLHAMADRA